MSVSKFISVGTLFAMLVIVLERLLEPLYSKSNYICAVLSDPNFSFSLFSFLWIVLKVWSRGMMCFTFSLSAHCVPNSPMWYSTFPIDPGTLDTMLTRILMVRRYTKNLQSQIRRLWCWIIRLKWKWGSYFHTCWYAPNCECIQLWSDKSQVLLTWLWDNGKQTTREPQCGCTNENWRKEYELRNLVLWQWYSS